MDKKIVVLTTGGTIASVEDTKTGLLKSGQMTGEELTRSIQLPPEYEVVVESVFQVPSTFMTFAHLIQLRDKIKTVLGDSSVTGVVITHGTDTLEESTYFLDLTLDTVSPVVVTGSQRGPSLMGTDAHVNLRQAILAAGEPDLRDCGTVVVFNERIFSARNVTKLHSYNVDGFGAPGYGYLGFIDGDQVYLYQKPIRRETYCLRHDVPRIDIVKSYLDTDGALIKASVEAGAKGLVIEGTGRGQVSPTAVDDVSAAIDHGVTVVLTSTCSEGQVYPGYDLVGGVYDLEKRGVILGKDYSSKKARIKLAVLLAADVSNIADKFLY